MVYNITDKLSWNEDPKLIIRDTELTINSDVETVLRLMDVMAEKGEAAGAREALGLLLDDEDWQKLAALRLKMEDYAAVVRAAVQLATGGDPGAADEPGE